MATKENINGQPVIDLSQIPTELLEQELKKRKAEVKELREKLKREKVCCKNCAYRIYGRTYFGSSMFNETWVCLKRPKDPTNLFGRVPSYNMAYYVCDHKYNGCELFLHKDSPKGREIVKENKTMSFRVID